MEAVNQRLYTPLPHSGGHICTEKGQNMPFPWKIDNHDPENCGHASRHVGTLMVL